MKIRKSCLSQEQYAFETLERYSGCQISQFEKNIILTNFPAYVDYFAARNNNPVYEGRMFKTAHDKDEGITILDIKIGSTAAALAVDLISFLPINGVVLLGMCAGLKQHHMVGDYILPTAGIRNEGTSLHYSPPEMPALPCFKLQRSVMDVLEKSRSRFHAGVTYTSNIRFWEFNDSFKQNLVDLNVDAYELECATLFTCAGFRRISLGALLLVSDLPLQDGGIKTKALDALVYERYMPDHIEKGIETLMTYQKGLKKENWIFAESH